MVHADAEVHQVDRLIDRFESDGSHPDVFGDLLESEIPVDRGTGVVGRLDRAFFQRREHLAAGKQRGLGADRREAFGDHAAGHAQLEVLEVLDRADRLLGMDDVRAVMDAADIHHVLLGEDFARHLQAVLRVEEHVPFVRIAQAHQI